MRGRAFAWIALAVSGGIGAVVALRARGGAATTEIRWQPAHALAPGVDVREGQTGADAAWRVVDLKIDPARVELRILLVKGGGFLEQMVPKDAVAAVNGGYFDIDFRPTGWLVDRSGEHAPRVQRASGGVLALAGAQLFIGPFSSLPFAPTFALQNGPRLVERGGRIGIRTDDGKRAARTIACETQGQLHLATILAHGGQGPTLLETARLLADHPAHGGLGCEAALNLDGGPSTGIWLAPAAGIAGSPPQARIAYGVAIVPGP